ncbi:MAG: C4-dicarboxylate ABC transporter [Thermoplasmata archaeon]|nr:MAG: C4-dicarboxylate ABC transporter [Thermoplasmata archaeon]
MKVCKCDILKNFSPAWFASVMGTGIVAVTTKIYSAYIPYIRPLSSVLLFANTVLFFILLIPWLLRWIYFPDHALADLKHPITSNFYATLPVGMLVLSVDYVIIGSNQALAKVFWLAGSVLTFFFGVLTPYIMFKGEHVKIDHINPAWFIPPVGLIVIPISGSMLLNDFHGIMYEFALLLNYIGWGAGFFIYLSLLSLCIYRFILHTPLPNILAPTVWINLGPIGAGTVALINLVKYSGFIQIKEPLFVFSLIFWGFGIWWVIIAILLTIHYIRKLSLPYALSWWAFTFPLGAYVSASHAVSTILNIHVIDYIGFSLYILLLFLWAITSATTLRHLINGDLFV